MHERKTLTDSNSINHDHHYHIAPPLEDRSNGLLNIDILIKPQTYNVYLGIHAEVPTVFCEHAPGKQPLLTMVSQRQYIMQGNGTKNVSDHIQSS